MKRIFCGVMLSVLCLSFACVTTQSQRVEQNEVVQNQEFIDVEQSWNRYNALKERVYVTNDEYKEMLRLAKFLGENGKHICSYGLAPILKQTTHDRLLDLLNDLDKYSEFYVSMLVDELIHFRRTVQVGEVERALFAYARINGGTRAGQVALVSFFMNYPGRLGMQALLFQDVMGYNEVPDKLKTMMVYLKFIAIQRLTPRDLAMMRTEFNRLMKVDGERAKIFLQASLRWQWGISYRYNNILKIEDENEDPRYTEEIENVYKQFDEQIVQTLVGIKYDFEDDDDSQYVQWACSHATSIVCNDFQEYIQGEMYRQGKM